MKIVDSFIFKVPTSDNGREPLHQERQVGAHQGRGAHHEGELFISDYFFLYATMQYRKLPQIIEL